jgi:hypothetical protein
VFICCGNVSSDLLPSSGHPSIVDSVALGNVFTEPLLSSVHMHHSTIESVEMMYPVPYWSSLYMLTTKAVLSVA